LLSQADHQIYQDWVKRIFSGRGRTLQEVLAVSGGLSRRASAQFCRDQKLPQKAFPRDLTASQWIAAFNMRSGA